MGRVLGRPWRMAIFAIVGCAGGIWLGSRSAQAQDFCVSDCDNSNTVLVNELITCVNIALDSFPVSNCPHCDADGNGHVIVNELILGVNNALRGCAVTPSPTEATPTATVSPNPSCPLEPGKYTITSGEGGRLRVGSLAEFAFPVGGQIIADVGPGDANCVHQAVVPSPGGFTSPTFCIATLGYSVKVEQTACGVGEMDSDGGSDYTVLERGDTSDKNGPCNLPQTSCAPATRDNSIHVNVKVGDGVPDTCTGTGHANAIVSIPVRTTTWLEASSGASCPANDGTFNPDQGDALITQFPQILDFTTDTNTSRFEDLDGDGCALSGVGPPVGFSRTGACMDVNAKTINTAATGTVGSLGIPLYDLAFSTFLPNTFTGPDTPLGATCDPPPVINFHGEVDRCIH